MFCSSISVMSDYACDWSSIEEDIFDSSFSVILTSLLVGSPESSTSLLSESELELEDISFDESECANLL